MHLRLDSSDIQTLIEMVCLAVQTATWNQSEGSQADFERFSDMEQRVMQRASEAGFGDWFDFDPNHQRLVLSEAFRETSFAQKCVDELRNALFWEEMMYRFAERDVIRRIGRNTWDGLTEEQRSRLTKPLEDRYWKEFREHGIDNFHLITPQPGG